MTPSNGMKINRAINLLPSISNNCVFFHDLLLISVGFHKIYPANKMDDYFYKRKRIKRFESMVSFFATKVCSGSKILNTT